MSLLLFPNAMDRIDDLLYIGCRAAADQCEALGFTHRVQLSASAAPSGPPPPSESALLFIQLDDDEEASLADAIPLFIAYMEQRDPRTDRVFLHCDAGVSRSASLALVYLMRFVRMRLDQALPHLQQCRPCVQPNLGFLAQLKEFDRANGEPEQ